MKERGVKKEHKENKVERKENMSRRRKQRRRGRGTEECGEQKGGKRECFCYICILRLCSLLEYLSIYLSNVCR